MFETANDQSSFFPSSNGNWWTRNSSRCVLAAFIAGLWLLIGVRYEKTIASSADIQESNRNILANWRPLNSRVDVKSVGTAACAKCHPGQASTQTATPMAHALEFPVGSSILKAQSQMTFKDGPFAYQIVRQGDAQQLTVSNGTQTISEPILYCFGVGVGGQTYVVRHDGSLFEVRVSYYRSINKLGLTIGQPPATPSTIEDALGRKLSQIETQDCFGCHAPDSTAGGRMNLDSFVPGVTCETCHGPGERHVAAVTSGDSKNLEIFNPRSLDSHTLSQEFCGTCHRGFDQVMVMPDRGGFQNVRFQPYRIFNSRGHNKIDSRISCIACHDPHKNVVRDSSFYDSKCLACHRSDAKEVATKIRNAAACTVSKKDCAKCHMPQTEIPGTHTTFTDHWIRVVKAEVPR